MRKARKATISMLLLVIPIMLWSYACSREEKFIGVYESDSSRPEYGEVYLELNKGGEGIRRIHEKNFAFRWTVNRDEIRIYTKSGGIIVGRLEGQDTLVVRFPGPRIVPFKKIK